MMDREDDAGRWRWLPAEEIEGFVQTVLLSPTREHPVIALTTSPRSGGLTLDPAILARAIGRDAEIVGIATGDSTWALSAALAPRLDVYGGGARVWWPGLSAESNPHDHPLMLFKAEEAEAVEQRIIAMVRGMRGRALAATERADLASTVPIGALTRAGKRVEQAIVTDLRDGRIRVRVGHRYGVVGYCDEKLAVLAARLDVGQSIPVFEVTNAFGRPVFSTQGLLRAVAAAPPTRPVPPSRPVDPWHLIGDEYREHDVVHGRVSRVQSKYVLIELLPSAALIAPIGELDDAFVRHPGDIVQVGDWVRVRILELDVPRRRGTVSLREAGFEEPRPPLSPGPGLPPFAPPDAGVVGDQSRAEDSNAAELLEELQSVLADRTELLRRQKEANTQIAELRKAVRSGEDRLRAVEARVSGELDPTESESAFLTAVRVEYARRLGEDDRQLHPLQRMRVGREFLARLQSLDGLPIEKVVEVCAQVACGRAHLMAGREVHELHNGEGGSPARMRERDGAKAWRCALQINTPSARRLHWWDIPGRTGTGRTIEFASVAVHDDFSIP